MLHPLIEVAELLAEVGPNKRGKTLTLTLTLALTLTLTLLQVGPNKRGKTIVQLSLSSKPKPVGATIHPIAGIPEFVSTLLSTLDPAGSKYVS